MMEIPEPRHKATGHSQLDLILGCLAIFISLVSVWIALREGRAMDRQVAAASWPNITYNTSNETPDGTPRISLDLTNTGVGPARIETFEVFYKDTPMAGLSDLAKACCAAEAGGKMSISTSPVVGEVLPARDNISFIALRPEKNAPTFFSLINHERFNVRVRICYCSVFDECWAADSRNRRPARVDACTPSQPVQFDVN